MGGAYAVATLPDRGGEAAALAGEWLRIRGAGSIGWPSDEAAVILAGDDPGPLRQALDAAGPVREGHDLEPTSRPTDDRPPEGSGVVALRWFELAASDWEEFLELSVGAWPAFEDAFDATILGLFRATDVGAPDAGALLVTRYASLATWEESRAVLGARSGSLAHSGRSFLRRHEITRRAVVRIGRPVAR